jgi:4'-phosphopantetheinyl transferase
MQKFQDFLKNRLSARNNADWRLGRWTAKPVIAAYLKLPAELSTLADVEIRATSSGAPVVFLHDHPAPVALSLSHRCGMALCTVGAPELSFGCDLELVEPRSQAFVADYFTPSEKSLIERAPEEERQQLTTLLWSAKESALKTLRVGLRLDTTCVAVNLTDTGPPPLSADPDGWRPLQVSYLGAHNFTGWWRLRDHMIRTIVSDLPLQIPVRARSASFVCSKGMSELMFLPEDGQFTDNRKKASASGRR